VTRYNHLMSRDAAEILRDALALPTDTRAALVDSLLDSLDSKVDPEAEELWEREILRRAQELDSGSLKTVPWAELRSRLIAKLGNDR
jgi:putative addiction module component (TIGR02574 family)